MMDFEFWRDFLRRVFVLGPFLLIFLNGILFKCLCGHLLKRMLEALKASSGFTSDYSRCIDHLGFLSRVGLLLSIGYALARSQRMIAKGKLDEGEVKAFPHYLKCLALVGLFGCVLNGLWLIVWIATLPLDKPLLASKVFDDIVSLSFLLRAAPFMFLLVSHGLVVYITRHHLHTLIDAIGLSHPFRSEHSVILERIAFINRSQLVIGIGLAVLFNGRKMGGMNLDCFELDALPNSFKRLALLKTLCLYVGVIWLIVGGVVLTLSRP